MSFVWWSLVLLGSGLVWFSAGFVCGRLSAGVSHPEADEHVTAEARRDALNRAKAAAIRRAGEKGRAA